MTDPEQILEDLEQLTAYLSAHHHRIPAERRAQALAGLERVEQLIPINNNQGATNG